MDNRSVNTGSVPIVRGAGDGYPPLEMFPGQFDDPETLDFSPLRISNSKARQVDLSKGNLEAIFTFGGGNADRKINNSELVNVNAIEKGRDERIIDTSRDQEHNEYNEDKWKSSVDVDNEDDDDSDYNEDDDGYLFYDEKVGPNSQQKNDQFTSEELFRKYANKITVEKYEGVNELPSGAGNKIISANKKFTANRQKMKDKQDRATVEQVMDPRTRMILYKLLSSEKVLSIDGCISTGKEANVYHATGSGPQEISYAIKIFKTSILTFKARDKYVSGEFRFRQGYCKKNPRKMVRLWAEKEYRNLLRIHTAGTVLVPQPRLLKSHVLVMDFIGNNGWPCPLLKDVKFDAIDFEEENSSSDYNNDETNPLQTLLKKLYKDALIILYRLYKHCKLVHADFSEFNLILKDNKDLYVIDVSQSVEHDHPRSFDFLRSDIKNVQDFFGKRVLVGDFKEIFDFITSPTVDDTNYLDKLDVILKNAIPWQNMDVSTEVFRQSYIPRKMEEVEHFERDFAKAKSGEADLLYANVMGMKSDLSGPVINSSANENNIQEYSICEDPDDSQKSSSSESDSETEGEGKFTKTARPKDETAEEKKERKKLVKQEKAEKRQNKVKKHVKKRQEKLSHHNSKKK